jgi:hypothetical protein
MRDFDGCSLLVFRVKRASKHHSLGYHESNRYENTDESREYADEEKGLDLFALPQLDGSLAAFDKSELHDVEHGNEFHDGQDRENRTKWKPNPKDELIKN